MVQTGLIAAVAVAFANYLGVFLPWVSQSNRLVAAGNVNFSSAQLVAILLVVFLTWINTRGVKEGAWVQNVLTIAKVGALAALIVAGIFTSKGNWSNFRRGSPPRSAAESSRPSRWECRKPSSRLTPGTR